MEWHAKLATLFRVKKTSCGLYNGWRGQNRNRSKTGCIPRPKVRSRNAGSTRINKTTPYRAAISCNSGAENTVPLRCRRLNTQFDGDRQTRVPVHVQHRCHKRRWSDENFHPGFGTALDSKSALNGKCRCLRTDRRLAHARWVLRFIHHL